MANDNNLHFLRELLDESTLPMAKDPAIRALIENELNTKLIGQASINFVIADHRDTGDKYLAFKERYEGVVGAILEMCVRYDVKLPIGGEWHAIDPKQIPALIQAATYDQLKKLLAYLHSEIESRASAVARQEGVVSSLRGHIATLEGDIAAAQKQRKAEIDAAIARITERARIAEERARQQYETFQMPVEDEDPFVLLHQETGAMMARIKGRYVQTHTFAKARRFGTAEAAQDTLDRYIKDYDHGDDRFDTRPYKYVVGRMSVITIKKKESDDARR